MSKLNFKVILIVVFNLILLGLLAFNAWMLWDFREATGKVLQNQAVEQQSQFAKIQGNFEKTGNQITEGMKPDAEIMASLTLFSKQSQDQHGEQAKIQERFLSDTATLGQEIKQNHDKLVEISQFLSDQNNLLSDISVDLVVQMAEIQKRIDGLVKAQANRFYIEGVKKLDDKPAVRNDIKLSGQFHAEGVKKWDSGDFNGAIADFKQAIRLNNDASGCYYNIALSSWRLGQTEQACDYAYKAGCSYLKNKDVKKANRMVELLNAINPESNFINQLRDQISSMPASE